MRTGLVAEKSTVVRVAAKRGRKKGAGTTLRMHSTEWPRRRLLWAAIGSTLTSKSECVPKFSTMREKCKASK